MPAPVVSIGIPTYNRAASLRKTLDSAVRQTYDKLEIVVCDNASTEETESAVREYTRRDPRVRYIRHPENRGALANFSAALHLATGRYFMWLADDDWLDDNFVEVAVTSLQRSTIALVGGLEKYYLNGEYSHRGRIIRATQPLPTNRVHHYFGQVSENGIFYGLAERSRLLEASLPLGFGADWIWVSRLAWQGQILTTEQTTIHRNLDGTCRDLRGLARMCGASQWEARWYSAYLVKSIFRGVKSGFTIGRSNSDSTSTRLAWSVAGILTARVLYDKTLHHLRVKLRPRIRARQFLAFLSHQR